MSQSEDEWYLEVQGLYTIGSIFKVVVTNEAYYMQVTGHHWDSLGDLVVGVYNLGYQMKWFWTRGVINTQNLTLMTPDHPDWPQVCAMQEACQHLFSLAPLRPQEGPDRREP